MAGPVALINCHIIVILQYFKVFWHVTLIKINCTVAAWCRNVETNATSQIWEENPRNPCASTSNLKLQTRGGQVANAWRDKTGSCRATNEGDWVTPTSEASPGVHYSKKHPFVVISIEKN